MRASRAYVSGLSQFYEETNMIQVRFQLVGVKYRQQEFTQAKVCINDVLQLMPEPNNVHDPKAIAIYKGGIQIGYVPRKDNQSIHAHVMAGQATCKVEAAWSMGCAVLVELP